ncbi:alginate export family protein [Pseudoxanthomonas sp. PXM02]|uniref:alginate export family protein n=1 Tax=Pseudoxanthomonas sp. PXM02 TaxID=2769294 RepID=UPI001780E439|nr:alginate export family protein [Pseudoxanthomonas sp. PXM02]MBD9477896.1 alginate export family protein [Pseudoxanthomonas sp. PXM02]
MRAVLSPVLLLMAVESSAAQFELLRYEDNFATQRHNCTERRPMACWKHRPLGEDATVSIGGGLRWRYEYIDNPAFGDAPQDRAGVVLQRYSIFADLAWGAHWRGFAQLGMSLAHGRADGPSPVDANRLDPTNLFGEWRANTATGTRGVRVGIQELRFGSGRLIDVREGPNVRRSFEMARAYAHYGDWRVDVIAGVPREHRPGTFDDARLDSQHLHGVYGAGRGWDVYLLHYEDARARYLNAAAHERRWTFGARRFEDRGAWAWNWEFMAQGGRYGNADIRAWSVATDTGYTFEATVWQPQVALLASIASGDRDPDDGRLQTFNPMYPRGNYFGDEATLGPRNFFNLQPVLRLQPTPRMELSGRVDFFWRHRTQDGVYAPNGRLIRAPGDSNARHVATIASLSADWVLTPGWDAAMTLAYFRPGSFLRETGAHAPLRHVEMTIQHQF